jgi:hypothetical protein
MLTIKCVVEFSKFLSFWIVREKGQGGTEFLISCIFFNYYYFFIEAADLQQNLSLDSQTKEPDFSEPVKKVILHF